MVYASLPSRRFRPYQSIMCPYGPPKRRPRRRPQHLKYHHRIDNLLLIHPILGPALKIYYNPTHAPGSVHIRNITWIKFLKNVKFTPYQAFPYMPISHDDRWSHKTVTDMVQADINRYYSIHPISSLKTTLSLKHNSFITSFFYQSTFWKIHLMEKCYSNPNQEFIFKY